MRKFSYIGVILSYCLLIATAVYYIFFSEGTQGLWAQLLVGLGVLLLSLALLAKSGAGEHTGAERVLRTVCLLPVYLLLIPLFLLALVFLFFHLIYYGFAYGIKKQARPLIKLGFKYSACREGGAKAHYLRRGDCVFRIIDNAVFDVSSDGGASYSSVFDSEIGEAAERAALRKLFEDYLAAGEKEKEDLDVTSFVLRFLVRNGESLP